MNPLSAPISDGMIKAQEYFREEKIDLPHIPPDEKAKIVAYQKGVYGSKIEPQSVYDIEAYVNEVLTKPTADFVIFGLAGHGVKSRGMHYYAVKENIALFIQLGYGGSSMDEAARDRINGIFHAIGYLFEAVEEAKNAGLLPQERRLLVVESDFYGQGWQWIDGLPGKIDPAEWKTDQPVILDALADIPRKEF